MEFQELVKSRKSIRGFKSDPVSADVIDKIIQVAKGAPSSMNTQPWFIHVVTGEPLDRIRKGNTEKMMSGSKPNRDIVANDGYVGVYRDRQVDIAKLLFGAMGIAREDKAKRQDWVMRGFRQFDAPVSMVLTYDKVHDPSATSHFDLGAVSYGLCLAAWEQGLGTVINGQGIMQSDVVREHANIPDSQNIMICIAMGYPDDDFAGNTVKAERAPNEDFVTYTGF